MYELGTNCIKFLTHFPSQLYIFDWISKEILKDISQQNRYSRIKNHSRSRLIFRYRKTRHNFRILTCIDLGLPPKEWASYGE